MHIYTIQIEEVVKFAIILTRISGIMILAPFFGSLNLPVLVKIMLSFVVSLLLYPTVPVHLSVPDLSLGKGFVLFLGEISIGLLIGLIARFMFAGFEMFGQFVSFQVGFSLINTIDPHTAVQSTVMSVAELFVGLMVFLGFDGHHFLLRALAESFAFLDPLKFHLGGNIIDMLINSSGDLFLNGVQLAAPVTVVLVITDVVFGMIGRAGTQIQILLIGLPLKSWLGFFCLSISFYFFPGFVEKHMMHLFHEITMLLKLLAA